MRIPAVLLAIALAAPLALAQRHPVGTADDTPQGQLLQQIEQESDAAKRVALLEQFATQFPKADSVAWVYEQLVDEYAKAGQPDKTLDAGQKLLAIDPADVAAAHECLKASEAKKDPALILKWSAATSELARKAAAAPQPEGDEAVEAWKRNVDYAKQVDIYTEYSLYAALLQNPDPKVRIQLGEALEQRNAQSQYFSQVAQPLFLAYVQAGQNEKGLAFAEQCYNANQASEEMMLAVAQGYMGKKELDKAIEVSEKAVQSADAKQKPVGVADPDWQTWKLQIKGRGEWIAGVSYATGSKWPQADKALRSALPGVRGNNAMLAETLFYLGLANYRIAEGGQVERARDAAHFSDECAAIASPFQAQARINAKAIRAHYRVQ